MDKNYLKDNWHTFPVMHIKKASRDYKHYDYLDIPFIVEGDK